MKRFSPIALIALLAACGSKSGSSSAGGSGTVTLDGSSTVFPIAEAVAEEFAKVSPDTKVTVAVAGTGGGFKRFCNNETDISNASRPIKASEAEACKKANVEYVEVPIAYDGIVVVVNPKNTWAATLTTADLKKMWEPGAKGTITNWNQVRPDFPDKPLRLFGPGTDSGTFDYFTEAINGKAQASRSDFTSSEDDNVLVQGVAADEGALGYFGFAYYEANKDKLKLVAIDAGKGPVTASVETVKDNSYKPLSRPLFIYVKKAALERAEVTTFVAYLIAEGPKLIPTVGYIPLPDKAYTFAKARIDGKKTGTIFGAETAVGLSIEQVLEKEAAN